MTTQELIELAVHETKGLWPRDMTVHTSEKEVVLICIKDVEEWEVNDFVFGSTAYDREYFSLVCDRNIFEMTAKELGYIDGYRWGVRYNYNGVKPNIKPKLKIEWWDGFVSAQCYFHQLNWDGIKNFKIIDPAWQPKDTSYLTEDASTFKKSKEPCTKAILCELLNKLTNEEIDFILSDNNINLEKVISDYLKTKEEEKQKSLLVDKACIVIHEWQTNDNSNIANLAKMLYKAGLLQLPKE
jgi:hypothetical protein